MNVKVALYYVLTRVQAKDTGSVAQVLSKIDRAILADEPCFVQSLITQLLATNVLSPLFIILFYKILFY
jgi:hypothetical protein